MSAWQGEGLQLQVRALTQELHVVKGRALRLIHPTSTATLEALAPATVSKGAGGGEHGDEERGQREAGLDRLHPTPFHAADSDKSEALRPPVHRQAGAGGAPDSSNQVDLEKFMREISAAGASRQGGGAQSPRLAPPHASALASMPGAAAATDDRPGAVPTPNAASSKLSPGAHAATWSQLDVPVSGSMATREDAREDAIEHATEHAIERAPTQGGQDVSAHSLAAKVDQLVQRHQGHANERHHAHAHAGASLASGASLAPPRQAPRQRSPGAGRIKTAAEHFIEERLGNVVVYPAAACKELRHSPGTQAQPLATTAPLSLAPRAISGWDAGGSAGAEAIATGGYDRAAVDRYLAQNNRTSLSLNSQVAAKVFPSLTVMHVCVASIWHVSAFLPHSHALSLPCTYNATTQHVCDEIILSMLSAE